MSEPEENSITTNRSQLRAFLVSIATIRGDLSNITAPPFLLDTKSAVELPAFWAERPSVFCAPASASEPERRALLVLKWFLSSLRNQQYAGRNPKAGVKKPLNAFLGELFMAWWEDEEGITRLVSEQVSHHPPVTACRVWNEKQGVYAEGFIRPQITFSGSVNIQQIGHAILRLEKWDESYLIPLPTVKLSGILSGDPYPELKGTYYIPSTNGYMSSIEFSGKSLFGSSDKKHSFEARLYKEEDETNPLYTVSGNWDSVFSIKAEQTGDIVETYDAINASVTALQTSAMEEMDEWETRKAWQRVREALQEGNMQGTSDSKHKVEEGQRQMRKDEERAGKTWETVFFKDVKTARLAETLAGKIGQQINRADTVGIWSFDEEAWRQRKRPFHGELKPDNQQNLEDTSHSPTLTGSNEALVDRQQMEEFTPNTMYEHANGTVNPRIPAEEQKKEVEQSRLDNGVAGMSLEEQTAVEDMLRSRYASG